MQSLQGTNLWTRFEARARLVFGPSFGILGFWVHEFGVEQLRVEQLRVQLWVPEEVRGKQTGSGTGLRLDGGAEDRLHGDVRFGLRLGRDKENFGRGKHAGTSGR